MFKKKINKLLKKTQNNDKIMIKIKEEILMINIRPISDLRNKYPEIEELVLNENEAVYLTKNGYGSMVVLSLEKYAEILKMLGEEKVQATRFGVDDIESALYEAEEESNNPNTRLYSQDEMEKMARRVIDGK